MDKKLLIQKIFKILPIYEKETIGNYEAYLFNLLTEISGLNKENMPISEVRRYLIGLLNLENVKHSVVRRCVLKMVNSIDRGGVEYYEIL